MKRPGYTPKSRPGYAPTQRSLSVIPQRINDAELNSKPNEINFDRPIEPEGFYNSSGQYFTYSRPLYNPKFRDL